MVERIALSLKAKIMTSEKVASAYLQYRNHPCLKNKKRLMNSLDELVNHIERDRSEVADGFLFQNGCHETHS